MERQRLTDRLSLLSSLEYPIQVVAYVPLPLVKLLSFNMQVQLQTCLFPMVSYNEGLFEDRHFFPFILGNIERILALFLSLSLHWGSVF